MVKMLPQGIAASSFLSTFTCECRLLTPERLPLPAAFPDKGDLLHVGPGLHIF